MSPLIQALVDSLKSWLLQLPQDWIANEVEDNNGKEVRLISCILVLVLHYEHYFKVDVH